MIGLSTYYLVFNRDLFILLSCDNPRTLMEYNLRIVRQSNIFLCVHLATDCSRDIGSTVIIILMVSLSFAI
jgi:hypothetical protein